MDGTAQNSKTRWSLLRLPTDSELTVAPFEVKGVLQLKHPTWAVITASIFVIIHVLGTHPSIYPPTHPLLDHPPRLGTQCQAAHVPD